MLPLLLYIKIYQEEEEEKRLAGARSTKREQHPVSK